MAKLDVNKKKVKLDILKITMFVADLINVLKQYSKWGNKITTSLLFSLLLSLTHVFALSS